ncbi:Signal peptidase I [Chitinispirillum alkaliphilum]|nr:Signal peptidase I [Chitinispirillum alkaliphilum]
MSRDQTKRSEKAGLLRLIREMGSALIMALIAIVYIIQAFKIPTGSMEDSLKVGDMLLGLKFVYGAPIVPFSQELGITRRFPALTDPKPGDVVIFKYPGTDRKDYIKRNIAGPGSVVEIRNQITIVDGEQIAPPPDGKYNSRIMLDERISNFDPLYIPTKGDVLEPNTMQIREFLFFKHLVRQENPRSDLDIAFSIYVDGENANNTRFPFFDSKISLNDLHQGKVYISSRRTANREPFNFNTVDDWTHLDDILTFVKNEISGLHPESEIELKKHLYLDGEEVESYTVRFDNYFMIGDNRNNSLDSRYWGYVNRNFIKARAFILYMSFDSGSFPWIRWDRLGRLIRSSNEIVSSPEM